MTEVPKHLRKRAAEAKDGYGEPIGGVTVFQSFEFYSPKAALPGGTARITLDTHQFQLSLEGTVTACEQDPFGSPGHEYRIVIGVTT